MSTNHIQPFGTFKIEKGDREYVSRNLPKRFSKMQKKQKTTNTHNNLPF